MTGFRNLGRLRLLRGTSIILPLFRLILVSEELIGCENGDYEAKSFSGFFVLGKFHTSIYLTDEDEMLIFQFANTQWQWRSTRLCTEHRPIFLTNDVTYVTHWSYRYCILLTDPSIGKSVVTAGSCRPRATPSTEENDRWVESILRVNQYQQARRKIWHISTWSATAMTPDSNVGKRQWLSVLKKHHDMKRN